MQITYKKQCYFYRKNNDQRAYCLIARPCCFSCSLYIRKIDGLDVKDHLNISLSTLTGRRSVFISMLALGVSFLTLALKITESFKEQTDSIFRFLLSK